MTEVVVGHVSYYSQCSSSEYLVEAGVCYNRREDKNKRNGYSQPGQMALQWILSTA